MKPPYKLCNIKTDYVVVHIPYTILYQRNPKDDKRFDFSSPLIVIYDKSEYDSSRYADSYSNSNKIKEVLHEYNNRSDFNTVARKLCTKKINHTYNLYAVISNILLDRHQIFMGISKKMYLMTTEQFNEFLSNFKELEEEYLINELRK